MNFVVAQCRLFLGRMNLPLMRKCLVALVGGCVLLVGIAMLVLPGPAILVIPLGLAILATEFLWAKYWLQRVRSLLPRGRQPPAFALPAGQAPHQMPIADFARLLGADLATGLAHPEVVRRQTQCGPNRITLRPGPPAWRRFLQQFHQPLVYLLLGAVIVTACLHEWVNASVIFGVVFVNALVGFLQETKAGNALAALASLVSVETTVRRADQILRVPAAELVPGDVVLLQAGDGVPADLRLFHVQNLCVDESALTGESLPVAKHPDPLPFDTLLPERKNMACAGTLVTSGEAAGLVWAIGDQTETGRIGQLLTHAVELSTPLVKKIAQFSQRVLWVILALAAGTLVLGLARGEPPVEMFMAAVALAVGAIPEGLPAAVTIVLAIGVARLVKRKAIIRRLPAVETLGGVTVICSDKTGTLTENQMTVATIFAGGQLYQVSGTGYEPRGEVRFDGAVARLADHPALAACLRAGVLCNDSQIECRDGRFKVLGDPTEAALLVAAEKAGLLLPDTRRAEPRLAMIPFASEQRFRATLHQAPSGPVIYLVGALERLLESCVDTVNEDQLTVPLDRPVINRAAEAMAGDGLRVLALARRTVASNSATLQPDQLGAGFTFLGIQGMMDPPRPAAIAAIQICHRAGIVVKMITGDHLATALAIARRIGLGGTASGGGLVALSGRDLEKITDADLPAIADRTAVFARVAPAQKFRLVQALQACGHVVAMTGDGVNDAPALKQADIGVAMGQGGTDVAKNAAAMILTDDNFSTIEAAIEEGRGVYANLTKFILWTLPTNAGEAMVLLVAIVLGTLLPVLPVQLLWVNMMTSLLLGLTLVFEPKERDLMLRPPRDTRRPLLTFPLLMRTGLVTLILLAGAFWLFFWELQTAAAGEAAARTAVINVIVLVEIGYLFSCRSLEHSLFTIGWLANRWVVAGSLLMLAAQLGFTYAPIMNQLFHTAPITGGSWLRILAVAATSFLAVEGEKWLRFGRALHPPAPPPAAKCRTLI